MITKVGDTAIESADDLSQSLARYEPGETVPVEINRDGERQSVDVKLGERPAGSVGG